MQLEKSAGGWKKDAGILAVSYIFLYICRILAL